ncbi:autotransporter outer membrane beta-barrel domain-containing protein [Ochrobactrum sp. RH2CCR150]|uniref:autotransporter outer membrane beta-barrel domain-containing protein n=1 Tax=Ochrobactrum sp. RH2CCR150 TaxID=2587044 RepID=UPI0015FE70E4|nr:outer membrane autotransporter protein [Ochrobactrum sp. RH2CCR150]
MVDGGAVSGNSSMIVENAGGGGAVTAGNGILVVDAINGGVTTPGAFSLARPVAAGPYKYTLHRGSAGDPYAWARTVGRHGKQSCHENP